MSGGMLAAAGEGAGEGMTVQPGGRVMGCRQEDNDEQKAASASSASSASSPPYQAERCFFFKTREDYYQRRTRGVGRAVLALCAVPTSCGGCSWRRAGARLRLILAFIFGPRIDARLQTSQ